MDYQRETLVAFVAAPSVCEEKISVVASAPAEWAARVTATLAKQLPAPSVPTRIFVVEKFVMKPVSGKIDRKCLPNLSHLLRNSEPEAGDTRWWDTPASDARDTRDGDVKVPDIEAGIEFRQLLKPSDSAIAWTRMSTSCGGQRRNRRPKAMF